jgi:hypothetical protein
VIVPFERIPDLKDIAKTKDHDCAAGLRHLLGASRRFWQGDTDSACFDTDQN